MKNTATKSFIVLAALILFSVTNATAQNSDLGRDRWKLTEAYGKAITNSSAYIDFDLDLKKFTGNTGCNRMFGSMAIRGRSMRLYSIGTTKSACRLMAGNVEEGTFLKALGDTVRYTQNGDNLSLAAGRGQTLLRFTRLGKADPDDTGSSGSIRLEDKKWILESIKNRQTFAPIKGAFVVFDLKKGSAGGDSGCNAYGGSYTSSGKRLSVTNIISTMRACQEGDKMEVERELFNGLKTANRYEIRDGRLFLYRNAELLVTFRGEPKS